MGKYFDKFPLVDYDGNAVKNILTKVDFTDQTKRDIYSNFDYVVEEGKSRPDLLSYTYYNSSMYDWLIYLSNEIVDPYHDMYKSGEDFNSYINAKYGSITGALSVIKFFRNDWSGDDRLLSPSAYEALVTDETKDLKKYWKPKLNNLGAIIAYERTQEDWIVSTNKIVEVTLSSTPDFLVGEVLFQTSTNAEGTVINVDQTNNILTLHHIINGEFEVNESEGITKVNLIQQAIPDEEASYWKPVSMYEYEEEQNEMKKYINMIKSSYLPDVEKLFLEKIR